MNPILQTIGKQNLGQIKSMMNLVKTAGNPQAMINQLMQTNPQMRNVMNYVNQNGGDPKRAFSQLAQQKGVDPDEILKLFR